MQLLWQSSVEVSDPRLANITKYKDLAAAVVVHAARDYIDALNGKNDAEIKRIERFFRSDLFTLYVNGKIEPEYLIKRLRNLVRHKKGIQIWAH